jgi:hypothetical protein
MDVLWSKAGATGKERARVGRDAILSLKHNFTQLSKKSNNIWKPENKISNVN